MKFQVLLFLVVVGWMAVVTAKSPGQFFCGRRLADTLAHLCPAMDKRGGMNSVDDYDYGWSWLVPRARAFEGRGKRGGVVSECCEQPCTIDELLSYC
ncbi:hypothetical protein ABMA27_004123 [Loxostege sticticalis]|uniref:Insulin-like domain-containing protein n=1 Tax=Loxostege sticticalis TaxID=481309 RepID=A0ABR3HMH9_LOXSC